MFLLMGVGYLAAGGALISEIVGGCTKKLLSTAKRASMSISSAASAVRPNSSRRSSVSVQSEDLSSSVTNVPRKSIFSRFRRSFDQRKSESIEDSNKVVNRHNQNNSLVTGKY